MGDARQSLEAERTRGEPKWDVLVVDAYSGDSIPVQLVTEEAFRLYGERLAPGGVLALHLSNWHMDLVPAAKAVHDRAGRRPDRGKKMQLKCISTVVKVSDPNRSWRWMCIREVLELVGMGVKNLSAIPWKFIREFRGRLPELQALRGQSKQKGAFL